MVLGADNENSTQLKQSVLELTDRFYHAWIATKVLNRKKMHDI